MRNTSPPARLIAEMFATKSSSPPPAVCVSPTAKLSPIVARGGVSALAMATPGRAALTSLRARAYAPAAPATNATAKSSRFGLEFAIISPVIDLSGEMRPMRVAIISNKTTPLKIASTI